MTKIKARTSSETEAILKELQEEYVKEFSNEVFEKMYYILYDYTMSILKKSFVNNVRGINTLDYYAKSVIVILYMEYNKDKTFRVRESFGKLIFFKCREAIYGKSEREVGTIYRTKKEKYDITKVDFKTLQGVDWGFGDKDDPERNITPQVSLNFMLPDGNEIEYIDGRNILEEVERIKDKYMLVDRICGLIFGIKDYCESPAEEFFRLMAVNLHVCQGEDKVNKFFKYYEEDTERMGKEKYMDTMELLRGELKLSVKETA